MRVLLFGATGQVGEALRSLDWDTELTIPEREEADLASPGRAREAIEAATPDLVINAAAYTAVDQAESEADLAMAVNRRAPGEMAEACAGLSIPLIHISTDFVFDGAKAGPYDEDDPVNPLSVYGRSKEAGERAVRDALERHVIIRTAWVFSARGRNFVKTMLRIGAERDELGIVDDQRGCPTAAGAIAQAIAVVAERLSRGEPVAWGTYHFCGLGEVTWYGFAQAIFEMAQPHMSRRPSLKPITTADYPTAARRPANSVLNCAKIEAAFGIAQPSWRDGLAAVIEHLYSQGELKQYPIRLNQKGSN